MLNYLWSFMILIGILWGTMNGNLEQVSQSFMESAKNAVTLSITMLGIMSFWCGIMEVGNRAGLVEWLTGKMGPILDFLFPEMKKEHPARKPIAVNLVANMLGIGMAATPAGLEAMKEMAKEAERSENRNGIIATRDMCNFLILNISSLQLIPVTMIAYRSQYGSDDPMAVAGPALIATTISTLAAVLFCKVVCGGKCKKEKR